ncbi:hypothetical protein J132_04763 [Termitomyces sp. J132]|nr:hypothetical protein J132_04763 [Termitomyces sp. J132]
MSSPSNPVVSPADLDEVVVYNSGGEEFEHWRHASVRDQSIVHGGGGGFSGGSEADQVSSHVAEGKGGILSGDLWEVSSLPALGGGTQQEATGAQVIGGPSGVSPLFPFPGHPLERSLSPPAPIPSITEVFLCKQVEALTTSLAVREGKLRQAREDRDMAWMEKEAMERERNTSVHVAMEQVLEVRGLRERLMQMEGQSLEAARRREDWLANKAALGHVGILRWVREHWVLLNGASTAFALIQDGLTQGSAAQPLELQQGMARLERLLAGHQQRNAVAPGLWWEVAADVGEALPGLAEVLAVVWAQMEVDLGVGLPGGPGRE